MPTLQLIHWENRDASALQTNADLRAAWDNLNAQRTHLPFLTSSVIVSALSILGDKKERLLIGRIDSKVVAMFVLCKAGPLQWQTFQPSQLPLGAWVAAAELDLQDLARALLRGPLGLCLGLSITQVDPLVAPRAQDTPDSQSLDYIDTGWVDIEGTFDDYWAARGKNLRQNMRKQRTKLATEGVTLTMKVLRDRSDMAGAIARYGQLESAGWKAQNGTAIHPENDQGKFYTEILEQASDTQQAVVYQYHFNEQVVAMNLCLFTGGTLVVLKTTYDESIKSFSPAFLLREEELKEIFETSQVKRIEYFGRLMDWHTKLTDKKRVLYHLTVYRWPLIKQLAVARRRKIIDAETPPTVQSTPE